MRFERGHWPSDPSRVEDLWWSYAQLTHTPLAEFLEEPFRLVTQWLHEFERVPEWAEPAFRTRVRQIQEWRRLGRSYSVADVTEPSPGHHAARTPQETELEGIILDNQPDAVAVVFADDGEYVLLGMPDSRVPDEEWVPVRYRLNPDARRFLLGEYPDAPPAGMVLLAPSRGDA